MTTADLSAAKPISYGCDRLGRLESVLMHTPLNSLEVIDERNHHDWLFDRVPDIPAFIDEHLRYRELLEAHGVRVYEVADHVDETLPLIDSLPNLTYMHDIAVVTDHGAALSKMAWRGRRNEDRVVREALENLGVPILHECTDPDDAFEGFLLLSEDTLLVAHTERHKRRTIMNFIQAMLEYYPNVIFVDIPKARRYMHPDTIFNRIRDDLALVYLPAFEDTVLFTQNGSEPLDFERFMKGRGVELVPVCDDEQRRLACTFVPLDQGVIFHYDTALDTETQRTLLRKGVELILFHPDAMTAGGGSLRCLTLRLHRNGR